MKEESPVLQAGECQNSQQGVSCLPCVGYSRYLDEK